MICDNCGSDNTQRLPVVYETGSQNINLTSGTVGVGGSRKGGLGVGVAATSSTGASQSLAAEKAAPPEKRKLGGAIIAAVIGLIILIVGVQDNIGVAIFGLVIAGLGVWRGYAAFKFNSETYPALVQTWQNTWYCNKCGHTYYHEIA